MRELRYSINVSLDGCVDHAFAQPNAATHQHAADWIARADALLLGRVTYTMMEEAWRVAPDGSVPDWMESWMEPFARTIDAAPKHVVSTTLADVDWNAQLLDHADLARAVRALKEQPGGAIALGGVALAASLAELDLIDEYQLVVHPQVVGHGPYLFASAPGRRLEQIDETDLGDGVVARRFHPVRP